MRTRKLRVTALVSLVALVTLALAGAAYGAAGQPSSVAAAGKACSSREPAIKVGTSAPVNVAGLSLKTAVEGVQAGIKGFNARGGIGGACMVLVVCDNMNDPNMDRNCAREFASDGVIATLNDFYNGDEAGAAAIEDAAHISRIGYNPGTAPSAVNSPYSFDFQAGGLGDTVAMVPGLLTQNVKKYAMLRVDVPAAAALAGLLKPMNDALGMTLTTDIPVSATTTDYTQYVLSAAQNGSGGAIIPLGNAQALQILNSAHQVSSKILYSGSLGTLSQKDMAAFGPFAKQIILSTPVPPTSVVGNPKYPGLKQAVADLAATGNPALQKNTAVSNALTGWMSVYALVTVMKNTPPAQITRDSVFNAFSAATNVNMLGLIPPWTPSAQNQSIFPGISNGDFTFWKWTGSNFKQFGPTVDVFKLLSGAQTSLNG